MNLNIIGYIIYLILTSAVILKVGNICYNNGNVFNAYLVEIISQKISIIILIMHYSNIFLIKKFIHKLL